MSCIKSCNESFSILRRYMEWLDKPFAIFFHCVSKQLCSFTFLYIYTIYIIRFDMLYITNSCSFTRQYQNTRFVFTIYFLLDWFLHRTSFNSCCWKMLLIIMTFTCIIIICVTCNCHISNVLSLLIIFVKIFFWFLLHLAYIEVVRDSLVP